MTIKYNGLILAQERVDGGTDGISGFGVDGQTDTQWDQGLRGAYGVPLARGNRKHTISFTVDRAPNSTAGAAMVASLGKFSSLAHIGNLLVIDDAYSILFSVAVLDSLKTKEREGLAYAVEMTFVVGAPAPAAVLGTESGMEIGTESGGVIGI